MIAAKLLQAREKYQALKTELQAAANEEEEAPLLDSWALAEVTWD